MGQPLHQPVASKNLLLYSGVYKQATVINVYTKYNICHTNLEQNCTELRDAGSEQYSVYLLIYYVVSLPTR